MIIVLLSSSGLNAQSLELMPGTERLFMDLQWLKAFDKNYKATLFSRTRLTLDYNNSPDIFNGTYINYTSNLGIGPSLIAAISESEARGEAGIHYFKKNHNLSVFALTSISLEEDPSFSWFSILRFRPEINEQIRLYSSLELYSLFNGGNHIFSVQRIRLGLDIKTIQFGFALNMSGAGTDYQNQFYNPGLFIRKEFN